MFSSITKKIYKKLNSYTFFKNIVEVVDRTPTYAVHWYILLVLGIIILFVQAGIAWSVFSGTFYKTNDNFAKTSIPITIQRDALENVINIYQARNSEFDNIKNNAPDIVNPGR